MFLYHKASNWLNHTLKQVIPNEVTAFCLNLYDDGSGVGIGFMDGDIEVLFHH